VIERESNPAELRRGLADLRNLVGDALEAVRDLALELRPPALDELGLIPALHWQIKQFGERSNVRTEFSATGLDDGERLPPELELVLYRVVQEALTNVAKHARATSVSVRIERTGDRVTATVRDDGRGFAVGEVLDSRERGLGLFGMQERAALVGGVLRIESEPGRGTQVSIAAPIRTPPLAKPDLEPELVR
jgi:two-component system sensor histidine kinase UhpB